MDGVVLDASEATIPVTDEGLLRGDGVFEVIRIYAGRPFALDQHLTRMIGSAAGMRLELDIGAVRADIETLLQAAGEVEGAVRVLVTRGGRRIALVEEIRQLPPTVALASITYAPTRILDGIKSLSYGGNMLATRLAQEQGADEAVLVTPHGRVLEAPTRSIFAVIGGVLRTPPLTDHILDSITRRSLLEVIEVDESPITLDELLGAQEAFLASTTHEVLPVRRVDDNDLPDAPGPLTREAGARLSEHIVAALVAPA
jgi:branched-chain amino acid aminotransferase